MTVDRVLRTADVAELLGISLSQVRKLTAQPGGIPHIRLGRNLVRYPESALNRWLADNAKPATASAPVVRPQTSGWVAPLAPVQAPEKQWCPTTGRRRPVDLT